MSRPNILFIHAESFDGRLLGFLGHPALRGATPQLDTLATEGTCFENTYANYPLCCPSRASMWSGRFAHHVGAWNNYCGLSPEAPTLADQLQVAGYTTEIIGKTDYVSGHHSGGARLSAWSRAAAIPRPVHGEPNPPCVFPDHRERAREGDWQKADEANTFLREQQDNAAPFFLYVGLHLAHHRFSTSQHYLEQIPEDAVALPAADSLQHPVLPLQRLQKNWGHALDPDELRLRRRIYFAMIAEVDALVGQLLRALDQYGLRDNTWVVFAGDHGEMAGEHRQYIKLTHFEASSRVPLIICGPDARANERVQTPASLVDLYPTFTDLAAAAKPDDLDGHSLVPELTGGTTVRPPRAFAEHHSSSCPTGTFMLRRDQWKYITYPGYAPLLFNLDDDPDELRDLAPSQPAMVETLDAEMRQVADYEAIDAEAKAKDRECFAAWRDEARRDSTYEEQMAATYSGAGHPPGPVQPWREEDEERIRQWLAGNTLPLPEINEEYA